MNSPFPMSEADRARLAAADEFEQAVAAAPAPAPLEVLAWKEVRIHQSEFIEQLGVGVLGATREGVNTRHPLEDRPQVLRAGRHLLGTLVDETTWKRGFDSGEPAQVFYHALSRAFYADPALAPSDYLRAAHRILREVIGQREQAGAYLAAASLAITDEALAPRAPVSLVMSNLGDTRAMLFRRERIGWLGRGGPPAGRLDTLLAAQEDPQRPNQPRQLLGSSRALCVHSTHLALQEGDVVALATDGGWPKTMDKAVVMEILRGLTHRYQMPRVAQELLHAARDAQMSAGHAEGHSVLDDQGLLLVFREPRP